ncbi:MAG: hypothetical protein OEZ65_06240 [Gemmatimonadota bacterium]|nr:hypothetical protein [Gemmatimonadota bacterium]
MRDDARAPLSPQRMAVVPPELMEAMREAVLDEDFDGLYELIDGVGEHDAEVAEYLRGLVEEYDKDALHDVFDVRGR